MLNKREGKPKLRYVFIEALSSETSGLPDTYASSKRMQAVSAKSERAELNVLGCPPRTASQLWNEIHSVWRMLTLAVGMLSTGV